MPIDLARNLVDLVARCIECLQKSCFGFAHLRAELFECIRFHKEEYLHCAVIAPETNAMVGRIEISAWIRKGQFHRWIPGAMFGSIFPVRVKVCVVKFTTIRGLIVVATNTLAVSEIIWRRVSVTM